MKPLRIWLLAAILMLSAACSAGPSVAETGSLLIVANKSDDTVDLIDPESGESLATLPTGNAPHEVEISPDGRWAVVTDYGDRGAPGSTLTVIDLDARRVASTIDLGSHTRPHGVAWLDGDRVAVTTEGSSDLIVVDVGHGEVVEVVDTGQSVSHMVAVLKSVDRAFVANIGSGTVTVIDLAAGRKLRDIRTGEGAEGIAIRPGTNEVWVTNRAADTITILDGESLESFETISAPGFPIRIEFAPSGDYALVSAASSGEVARVDARTRAEVARKTLDLENAPDAARRLFGDQFGESPVPVGIQFSSDGRRAYIAATQSDAVVVIDPETLEVINLIRAGREPDGMAWAD